ncbi:thioredoxin family protein [Rhodothermus profundi]|uniref:Tetratricopeptide repeat-containing protein n=1 Tax=Rhodothermus profundi TaxID=633813 RepID=A0A1M6RD53_9BACT|nr:thioredoxin family protein [Rhodothermus profundi]SHK30391.1 Tetratricopeptide repeat-containing protein [Rhodothermus profundi]
MNASLLWLHDLDAALAEARRTRRPVWLMFEREGCAGCAKMEANTYRDPQVRAELTEAFVLLRQNIRRDRLVRSRYAAVWTPSFYVLDARGTAHHVELGYLPPEDLRLVLRLGRAKELVPRGRYTEAIALLEDALTRFPTHPMAAQVMLWWAMARYLTSGDGRQLREDLAALRRRYPDSAEARRWPWNDLPTTA